MKELKENGEMYTQLRDNASYLISDKGNVWSLKRNKTLKCTKNKDGYDTFSICSNGDKTTKYVYKLVAEYYLPKVEGKPIVDHKTPVSLGGTNEVSNLRWCTIPENNNNTLTLENLSKAMKKVWEKRKKQFEKNRQKCLQE